jgi:poly(A) polymerase/tRNA nucleotidyltransferase (CCA-adding enzyme)
MSEPPVQRIEPPAFLAEPMLAAVLAALPEARVVGGAVRDALAGRTVAEVDLATPHTPEQVQKALQAAGIRVVPTGLDHGTVTAVANESPRPTDLPSSISWASDRPSLFSSGWLA